MLPVSHHLYFIGREFQFLIVLFQFIQVTDYPEYVFSVGFLVCLPGVEEFGTGVSHTAEVLRINQSVIKIQIYVVSV